MNLPDFINLPAICIYLLGSVFVLTSFEPDEESGPAPLLVLSAFWPFITVWAVVQEMFFPGKE